MLMMDREQNVFSSISVDYDHHIGNRGGLSAKEIHVNDGGAKVDVDRGIWHDGAFIARLGLRRM